VHVGGRVLVRVLFLPAGGMVVLVGMPVAVGMAVLGAVAVHVLVGVLVDVLVRVHRRPPQVAAF
jgi:hypothetical protein